MPSALGLLAGLIKKKKKQPEQSKVPPILGGTAPPVQVPDFLTARKGGGGGMMSIKPPLAEPVGAKGEAQAALDALKQEAEFQGARTQFIPHAAGGGMGGAMTINTVSTEGKILKSITLTPEQYQDLLTRQSLISRGGTGGVGQDQEVQNVLQTQQAIKGTENFDENLLQLEEPVDVSMGRTPFGSTLRESFVKGVLSPSQWFQGGKLVFDTYETNLKEDVAIDDAAAKKIRTNLSRISSSVNSGKTSPILGKLAVINSRYRLREIQQSLQSKQETYFKADISDFDRPMIRVTEDLNPITGIVAMAEREIDKKLANPAYIMEDFSDAGETTEETE